MATASPLNNRTYDHGMGFGTQNQQGVDFSRGQIFEKTNHTTRRAHIFDIESGKRGGVYYMKTYEALPPKMPKPLPL